MMTFRKIYLLLFISITAAWSQENPLLFYQSRGLALFNQGNFRDAITSIREWSEEHLSEKGTALYYIGECYYNLGLSGSSVSQMESDFLEAIQAYRDALQQPDLTENRFGSREMARYKTAWSLYRLAEIDTDPRVHLERAYGDFMEISAALGDSLRLKSLYMALESGLQLSKELSLRMYIAPGQAQALENGRKALSLFSELDRLSDRILAAGSLPAEIRIPVRIRKLDIAYERGRLFQNMNEKVFSQLDYPEKRTNANETAIAILSLINYPAVLEKENIIYKREWMPIAYQSEAFLLLNLYLLSGDPRYDRDFLVMADSLEGNLQKSDVQFLKGMSAYYKRSDERSFLRLADPEGSIFSKAEASIPESSYWLGWVNFIISDGRSEDLFLRYANRQPTGLLNVRSRYLMDEARYRAFLIRFERNVTNASQLRLLLQDIDSFHTDFPSLARNIEMIEQLVSVGAGERIWGGVLNAQTSKQKLDDAFLLIQKMLEQATRVTGKRREPYLNYLDRLFTITQGQRSKQTTFYRGLALFLNAEIQETPRKKREMYLAAADTLKRISDKYQWEAKYVRARSYFASAKHAANESSRNDLLNQAKPLFEDLINQKGSVRSLYYLGEIYRSQNNPAAARVCYRQVIEKTGGKSGGRFWHDNARAGIESSGTAGDSDVLSGIKLQAVIFPEVLLEENGEPISLERFADPNFVKNQYWEESLSIYLTFGLPKRHIYPSVHKLAFSSFTDRIFTKTASIQEKVSLIASGLRLKLLAILPLNNLQVTFDNEPINANAEGVYFKKNIMLNHQGRISATAPGFLPFRMVHHFTMPGVETINAVLSEKVEYQPELREIKDVDGLVTFPERLDGNVIFQTGNLPITKDTHMYTVFTDSIKYRDFVYSQRNNGYLALNSEKGELVLFNNNSVLSRRGIFKLTSPDGVEKLNSPEGLCLDSEGNIYVADWGNHRIVIFEPDGTYLRSFGTFGINDKARTGGEVQLLFPSRLAIAEDRLGIDSNGDQAYRLPIIFVTDRTGVQMMDTFGTYLGTLPSLQTSKVSLGAIRVNGFGKNSSVTVITRNQDKAIIWNAVQ